MDRSKDTIILQHKHRHLLAVTQALRIIPSKGQSLDKITSAIAHSFEQCSPQK